MKQIEKLVGDWWDSPYKKENQKVVKEDVIIQMPELELNNETN